MVPTILPPALGLAENSFSRAVCVTDVATSQSVDSWRRDLLECGLGKGGGGDIPSRKVNINKH